MPRRAVRVMWAAASLRRIVALRPVRRAAVGLTRAAREAAALTSPAVPAALVRDAMPMALKLTGPALVSLEGTAEVCRRLVGRHRVAMALVASGTTRTMAVTPAMRVIPMPRRPSVSFLPRALRHRRALS